MKLYLLIVFTVFSVGAHVLNINKGVIVHLFEWTFADIARECEEFLAPNGFSGVQISPPNENVIIASPPRPWWERYQPVSYKIVSRSGSEREFQDMLNRCNKVGVKVFADVVLNHMTGQQQRVVEGVGGSTADPKSYSYPAVPYTVADFHRPPCSVDYENATRVRNCELMGLRDLDNSRPYVRKKQLDYLNKLIEMGVAGFRVDAAKHMWPADLKNIYRRLNELDPTHGFPKDTRPLIYQQVVDLGGEAVKWQEYSPLGMVTDFRYGLKLGKTFLGKRDLASLKDLGSDRDLLPDDVALVFVDNHDTQRDGDPNVLTYKNPRLYKMAVAFMLAYPWGTPRLMSSYYFDTYDQGPPHDSQYRTLSPQPITNNICSNKWVCEHRWRQVYNMVRFHNVVAGTKVTNWWDNGKNQISFCRGNKGFIAFNRDSSELKEKLQTGLPKGEYCDIISGSLVNGDCTGRSVQVGEDGTANIRIAAFTDASKESEGFLALHINARVKEEYKNKKPNGDKTGGGTNKKPSEGNKQGAGSGTNKHESMCEGLIKLLGSGVGDADSGGSVPGNSSPLSAAALGSKCQKLSLIFKILDSGNAAATGSGGNPSSFGNTSKCEKLLQLLTAADGVSSSGGMETKKLNLLIAAARVRRMDKIIGLLSTK